MSMKYMLSWNERSQGSPMEYENAQEADPRGVHAVESSPKNFKIELFRHSRWRLGRIPDVGLRRSVGGSQVLLDAAVV